MIRIAAVRARHRRSATEATASSTTRPGHYSWNWRAQIKQQDEFRVVTEKYVLDPVGG